MAAKQGYDQIVEYLIDQQANINITDNNGVSTIMSSRLIMVSIIDLSCIYIRIFQSIMSY